MQHHELNQTLLPQLSTYLNVKVQLDAEGMAYFKAGDFFVCLRHLEINHSLHIFTELANPADFQTSDLEQIYIYLLQLNCFHNQVGDGNLGLTLNEDAVYYSVKLAETVDSVTLCDKMKLFLTTLQQLHTSLAAFVQNLNKKTQNPSSDPNANIPAHLNFFQFMC